MSPDISLICTVYNEEDSVQELLQSVLEQNRTPEEAVFVDGGSTDNTQNILKQYSKEHDLIRFEVEDGANISEGRNRAIELAENDHIVGTDGGCILKENWCREMEKAFEEGNKALTGLFEPIADNTFKTVQGELRAGHFKPENVSQGQPPSARSVGFTKQVWRDAGKFPEDLYTGEDAKFCRKVEEEGYDWHVVQGAMVRWHMRPSWEDYWKQFKRYGEGDARAGGLLDYPAKILGVSKLFWRTIATWTGILGILLIPVHPGSLLGTVAGFGAQLAFKAGALRSSVEQAGIKAVPYWAGLVLTGSLGHFTGYYTERTRSLF